MHNRNAQLVQWEADYKLVGLPLRTDDGVLWQNRLRASEAYFNDYSWDWDENLELLSNVRQLYLKYGDYVMLADAIAQSFITDIYYRNPRPLVQDKQGNRDLGKMMSDVLESVHQDADTEEKMQFAFYDQFWSGFGMPWVSFSQQVDVDQLGYLHPKWQKVLVHYVSPWHVRFDPNGRRWDLTDHRYLAIIFFPSMSTIMNWQWMTDEDRRRIVAWRSRAIAGDTFGDHGAVGTLGTMTSSYGADSFISQRIDYTLMGDEEETDPDHTPYPMVQIWDRTKKTVLYQPPGALFTLTPQPWPEEFADSDTFPGLYMAKNREPLNRRGTLGFIGVPDIRRIKPHLLAINRLEALFLAANQHAIFKYLSPKGALNEEQQEKLQSDKQRQVIEWDETALSAFPTVMQNTIKVEDVLRLVPQPDLQETRHLEGIKHEMDMIAQIIGQSPGDRGGMPITKTATDSAIIDARLKAQTTLQRHKAGKQFAKLTRLMFLVLKQRQELPIQYQMTTTYNQKVWSSMASDKLRELDLHFDYAVGSGESRTPEQEFALRQQAAAVIMPFLQATGDTRAQMKLVRDLVEPLNLHDVDDYFTDDVRQIVMQLEAIMYGIQRGEINPAVPAIAAKQLELISMLAGKVLTPADMQQIVSGGVGGEAPAGGAEPGGAGAPSAAKPDSAGEAAFSKSGGGAMGSAAAGAIGGMSR